MVSLLSFFHFFLSFLSFVGAYGVVFANVNLKLIFKYVLMGSTNHDAAVPLIRIKKICGAHVANKHLRLTEGRHVLSEINTLKRFDSHPHTPKYRGILG